MGKFKKGKKNQPNTFHVYHMYIQYIAGYFSTQIALLTNIEYLLYRSKINLNQDYIF